MLANRLDKFIESSGVLPPEQFGFWARHSTQQQLWWVSVFIHEALDKKSVAGFIFVDLAKAFDKIYINGLIYKLIKFNTPKQLIKIFHDYLNNRSFTGRINSSYSSPQPILSGVPQESL